MRERCQQRKAKKGKGASLHFQRPRSVEGPVQNASRRVSSKRGLLEVDGEKGTLWGAIKHPRIGAIVLSSIPNECVEKLYEHLDDKECDVDQLTINLSPPVVHLSLRGIQYTVSRGQYV